MTAFKNFCCVNCKKSFLAKLVLVRALPSLNVYNSKFGAIFIEDKTGKYQGIMLCSSECYAQFSKNIKL